MRYSVKDGLALITITTLVCCVLLLNARCNRLQKSLDKTNRVGMTSTEALDYLQEKWRNGQREEQDDPVGAVAAMKVGDRVALSNGASTWEGPITKIGSQPDCVFFVRWYKCSDIFDSGTTKLHEAPIYITRPDAENLIRTGWLDLLDY